MNTLILPQGPPASGKSTWAREWQLKDPGNRVIISRDALRHMRGKYWIPSQEPFIICAVRGIVEEAMTLGYDICLDETNMNPKTLEYWHILAQRYHYDIEFVKFEAPYNICVERDKQRDTHNVGEEVINKFFEKYNINKETGKINENTCTW